MVGITSRTPVVRVLILAISITVVIWSSYFLISKWLLARSGNNLEIRVIVGDATTSDVVPSQILVELLQLQCNSQLDAEGCQEALEVMRRYPAVASVQGSLARDYFKVRYTMKAPRFSVGGYENLAVSEDPVTFPLLPLYSPRELVKLFITTSVVENDPFPRVHGQQLLLAIKIFELLKALPHFKIEAIDVRLATATSWYRREIGVQGKYKGSDKVMNLTLRLPAHDLEEKMQKIVHFLDAQVHEDTHFHEGTCGCIDARFSHQLLI